MILVCVMHAEWNWSELVFGAGFEDRKQLYMLYHYLNHYNLFGGGYRSSAENILRQLTRKYA